MAVFDITGVLLNVSEEFNPFNRQPFEARPRMTVLVDWLHNNVGTFYGGGDDNIVRIGSGWEIFKLYNGKPKAPEMEDCEVKWYIDITDEAKSTLFALKWIS